IEIRVGHEAADALGIPFGSEHFSPQLRAADRRSWLSAARPRQVRGGRCGRAPAGSGTAPAQQPRGRDRRADNGSAGERRGAMTHFFRRAVALVVAVLVSWRASVSSAEADESPLPLDSEARKTAPAPGPEPAFSLPPIYATVLDNGIRLLLIERHELPLVAVR